MFPPREPHAQRRRGIDHAQSTSLECGGGKLGMDDEVLEGGGSTGKAVACGAFHALIDSIHPGSQALTDMAGRVGPPGRKC